MEEWEKQLDELRVQNKIARAALFDNIQALDARVARLEDLMIKVRDLFEAQSKVNEDLNNLFQHLKGKNNG